MPVIACKLPHGLDIRDDDDQRIVLLLGGNIGSDLENIDRNGSPSDNRARSAGYGLTVLSDAQAEAYQKWADSVTYRGGKKANGKLLHGFPALENGSILGPFASIDEARQEVTGVSAVVTTGFEGLDPEKEEKLEAKNDLSTGKTINPEV